MGPERIRSLGLKACLDFSITSCGQRCHGPPVEGIVGDDNRGLGNLLVTRTGARF